MVCFRPRLRFSLRTLFVLVTLVCLWLGPALNWMRQRSEARAWLKDHGGYVDQNCFGYDPFVYCPHLHPAPWNIRILGEAGVASIWVCPHPLVDGGEHTDPLAKTAELRPLFPEADFAGDPLE